MWIGKFNHVHWVFFEEKNRLSANKYTVCINYGTVLVLGRLFLLILVYAAGRLLSVVPAAPRAIVLLANFGWRVHSSCASPTSHHFRLVVCWAKTQKSNKQTQAGLFCQHTIKHSLTNQSINQSWTNYWLYCSLLSSWRPALWAFPLLSQELSFKHPLSRHHHHHRNSICFSVKRMMVVQETMSAR